MRKTVIVATVLIISPIWASATIINIPADYPAIQQGIDASVNGDTVLVQPGVYYENVNFNGHNIVLGSVFLTTGDTSYIYTTIIDGDSAGVVIRLESNEDSTTAIMGLTIQNGFGDGFSGGIRCSHADPRICNNIIVDNSTTNLPYIGFGGAISGVYSSLLIKDNIIESNFAGYMGGGIYLDFANAEITGNTIIGNYGSLSGGGIYSDRSHVNILNNYISNNTAGGGAGIYCADYNNIINNNVIYMNTAYGFGGGIECDNSNSTIITNNTISENLVIDTYLTGGGGIFSMGAEPIILNNLIIGNEVYCGGNFGFSNGGGIWGGYIIINNTIVDNISCDEGSGVFASGYLTNNIIRGNSIYGVSSVSYSNVEGGWPGEGNIDEFPLFRYGSNYHLMSIACGDPYDSPCIDAGSPYYADSLLDCSWGLGTTASDMGAYGGGDTAFVGIWDTPSSLPDRFMLLQNYPNPFNAYTTIRFILPKAQDVELTIYDLLGRRIEVLLNEYREAGVHEIIFDASALSSGVYFYRLRAGDMVETKRMVLLK